MLGQVDLRTGEKLETGFVAYFLPKRKNGFGQGWFAMSQDFGLLLAKVSTGLRGQDLRVLLALFSLLDFENLLIVNQTKLAREIGIRQPQVAESIKELVARNIIEEGPKLGVYKSYRLRPEHGWKGSAKGHLRALRGGKASGTTRG